MKTSSDFATQKAARLARLRLEAADFEEKFARSSGPGGQHVNKVSTAVTLRHMPSGQAVTVVDVAMERAHRDLQLVGERAGAHPSARLQEHLDRQQSTGAHDPAI